MIQPKGLSENAQNWWLQLIWKALITHHWIFSQTKWESMSNALSTFMENKVSRNMHSWLTVTMRCRLGRKNRKTHEKMSEPCAVAASWIHCCISALADDRETSCCFFDWQEIRLLPAKTQLAVIERLESIDAPQFASLKAFRCTSEE